MKDKNHMEDNALRELFAGFSPRLSGDAQFMDRLARNLEVVAAVREQLAERRRRNRVAVVVAALAGFAAGVLMTLLYPLVAEWFTTVSFSIPRVLETPAQIDTTVFFWMTAAALSGLTAYYAYQLAAVVPGWRRGRQA